MPTCHPCRPPAATVISQVDFLKLVDDLQDVETKVMARKMLLEGGSSSAANTPTGAASRRAESVASDASTFHVGTDLLQQHSFGAPRPHVAADGEASAAGARPRPALGLLWAALGWRPAAGPALARPALPWW